MLLTSATFNCVGLSVISWTTYSRDQACVEARYSSVYASRFGRRDGITARAEPAKSIISERVGQSSDRRRSGAAHQHIRYRTRSRRAHNITVCDSAGKGSGDHGDGAFGRRAAWRAVVVLESQKVNLSRVSRNRRHAKVQIDQSSAARKRICPGDRNI